MGSTGSATVAEMAVKSSTAAHVFESLGLDYLSGSTRSFEEACRDKQLDPAAVLAEIERRSKETTPRPDWVSAPLAELTAHIVSTHHAFLKRELPLLSERMARVAEVYGERDRAMLSELPGVFLRLCEELNLHMRKEEMMLFPTIDTYEAAASAGRPLPPTPFGSVANPIAMMEMEHESANGALAKLRELTSGYAVPAYACVTYRALIEGLRDLEADLHIHIHLENNILFPRAIALERAVDSRT
jgi:regulator of cell morphogenesis and NO signaling